MIRGLLAILWVAGLGGAARADAPEPSPSLVMTQPGFGIRVREDFWTRMQVSLENPGEITAARIAYTQDASESGLRLEQAHEVSLPARSRLELSYPAYIGHYRSASDKPTSTGQVHLKTADGRVFSSQAPLTRVGPSGRAGLLTCDQRSASYNFLDEFDFGAGSRPALRMPTRPGELPLRPEMLDGVELIILGMLDEAEYPAAALSAVDTWVRSGGILMVAPAGDTPLAPPPTLAALLPVIYTGKASVSRYHPGTPRVPALDVEGGIDRYDMIPMAGEMGLGTAAHPVSVVRRHGHGAVVALNVDTGNPAFQDWERAADFLHAALPAISPIPRYAGRLLTVDGGQIAESMMLELAGRKVPGRWAVALILAVVGTALGGSLVLGRRRDRPLAGWLGAGLAALVAGGGILIAARVGRADANPVINSLTVSMPSADGLAIARHAVVGCYTPRERTFRWLPRGDAATIRPQGTRIQPPEVLQLGWRETATLEALPVRTDALRMVSMQTLAVDAPDVPRVTVTPGAEGLAVSVTNPSGRRWDRALLRHRRMGLWLPPVAPESEWREEGLRPALGGTDGAVVVAKADRMRQTSMDLLFSRTGSAGADWNATTRLIPLPLAPEWAMPRCYAWSSGGGVTGLADDDEDLREGGLDLLRLPVHWEWAAGPVWIPPGILPRDLAFKSPAVRQDAFGPANGVREGLVVYVFSAPDPLPPLHIDALRVRHRFVSGNYDVTLLARAGAASPGDTSLEGYRTIEDGEPIGDIGPLPVSIAVRVTPLSSGVEMSAWELTYLELEIEGTLDD